MKDVGQGARRFHIASDLNIELGLLCSIDDDVGEVSEMYGPQCWQGCDVDVGTTLRKNEIVKLLLPGRVATIKQMAFARRQRGREWTDVTAGLHTSWAQDGLKHDVLTQQRQALQSVGPFSSICYDVRR